MTYKTNLVVKSNEVVRLQFDAATYVDLSIDINGKLTVHALCGIKPDITNNSESDKIAQHNLILEDIINGDIKKEHELMYQYIKNKVGKDFNVALFCHLEQNLIKNKISETLNMHNVSPIAKANELIDLFQNKIIEYPSEGYPLDIEKQVAIRCAELFVTETLKLIPIYTGGLNPKWVFWNEVDRILRDFTNL